MVPSISVKGQHQNKRSPILIHLFSAKCEDSTLVEKKDFESYDVAVVE